MSRIRDRLQALHRRSAVPAPDEAIDRAALLAAYIEQDQAPAPALEATTSAPPGSEPAAADVPPNAATTATTGNTAGAAENTAPEREPAPSDLRARLQRLHRVPSHVGPPSSFAAPEKTRPTPAAPPRGAAAAVPAAPKRPAGDTLLARLGAATDGVHDAAPGLARVRAPAPRPTLLGRYDLHEALDVIVTLDDVKLMLPVGIRARDAIFFDIESTGLAFDSCHAFVLGAATVSADDVVVEQLVPLGSDAEAESIRHFAASVAGAAAVVTFNGARFDLPFLAARSALHGLPDPFAGIPHIDLYRVARHTLRKKLHRYSLAALEAHALGMHRVDDLPGREAPGAYLRFLATGDATDVARVLEHNRLDLLSMIPLLGVLTGEARLAPTSTAHSHHTAGEARLAPTSTAQHRDGAAGDARGAPTSTAHSHHTAGEARGATTSTAQYRDGAGEARLAPTYPMRHRDGAAGDASAVPAEDQAASGFIALGAHEHARAAELLAGAIASGLRGPMRRRALRELGRLALGRGETSEAVARLEQACAEPGGDAESHALLAEVYEERLNEAGHALRHARRAVTLQPWNGPMRERLARLELHFS